MVKVVAIKKEDEARSIMECERLFRKATVKVATDFSEEAYDIWTWTKKRLRLTRAEDVVPSRHHSESKQKIFVCSGAESIWESTSLSLFSLVREYIPTVLDTVPNNICPVCGENIKIYSNRIRIIRETWDSFFEVKKDSIELERKKRLDELVELFRGTRIKFKLVLSPKTCYDSNKYVLPQYKKTSFLPELQEKWDKILIKSINEYIKAIIVGLPDMVACDNKCEGCGTQIMIYD